MRRSRNTLPQQTKSTENILDYSSEIDSHSKRNSWWKNISDNRCKSLIANSHSNKSIRLNADSSASNDENSQWWKNLPENVQLPINIKRITGKENKSQEKEISQLETDESANENFVPKKSIFASQEVQSQKSRYSHAFNLKPKKSMQEYEQPLEPDIEIENINSVEEPKLKGTKKYKKRKTKTIFKPIDKKRKYSDIFISSNIESQETNQDIQKVEDFTEQTRQKNNNEEDSNTENVSQDNIQTRKEIFKINQKKKKYSEAFTSLKPESFSNNLKNKSTEIEHDSNTDVQKEDSNINNSLNVVKEKKELFKTIQKKKKYSEAFASNTDESENEATKKNDHQNESSVEENVQTAAKNKQLFQINQKKYSKAFAVSENENIDKENSEEEIFIKEVLSQKDTSVGNNRISRNRKSNTSVSKNKNLGRQSEKNKTADISKLSKNDDDLPEETLVQENVAAEKKLLFQTNQKKKKYSKAFAVSENENIDKENSEEIFTKEMSQKDASVGGNRTSQSRKSNTSELKNKNLGRQSERNKSAEISKLSKNYDDMPEESLSEENIGAEKKQLFQINQKKKKYSEAFAVSKSILVDSESSEEEIYIEDVLTQKNSSVGSNRTLRNRKSNTSVSKNKKLSRQSENTRISHSSTPRSNRITRSNKNIQQSSEEEENVDDEESEPKDKIKTTEFSKLSKNDDLSEESLNEENVAPVNKQLFKINPKNKKYSEAFAVSKNILVDSESSEEEIYIKDVLTQKNASVGSNRTLRNRKSNTSVSKNKKLSRQSENTRISHSSTPRSNRITRSNKNIQQSSEEKENVDDEESEPKDKIKTTEFSKLSKNDDLSEESLNEENVAPVNKQLFKINPKNKKYSEAFAVSKNILVDSESSENEIDVFKKNTTVGSNRSLRNRKSNTSVSKNKNLSRQSERNKTTEFSKLSKNDDLSEESLNEENVAPENKKLFKINAKNKKYSEAFAVSKNTLVDSENSEEEIYIEDVLTQKNSTVERNRTLTKRKSNTSVSKNKNLSPHSESTRISHSLTPRSNRITRSNKNIQQSSEEKENVEDEESEPKDKMKPKSLFQANIKNRKYSEAFLNATKNSQKNMKIAEHNMEQEQKNNENEVAEVEENDETPISSISSIDVSDKIKHPLFNPRAHKCLYTVQKAAERPKISTDGDVKTKTISNKRMSLPSSSPTDSVISKFFEDNSLISSTKLLINPNGEKSGVSEGSSKKKRRQSRIPSIKETNEVNMESETNQDVYVEGTHKNRTLIVETKETESPNNKNSNKEEVVTSAKAISKRNSKLISSSSNSENINLAKNKNHSNILNETNEIKAKSPSLNKFTQNSIKSLILRNSQSSIKHLETSNKSTSQQEIEPNKIIPEENVNSLRSSNVRKSASNTGINNLPENYTVRNTPSSSNKRNTNLEAYESSEQKSAKEKQNIHEKSKYSLSTHYLDTSSLSDDEDPYDYLSTPMKGLTKSSSTKKTISQNPIELSSNNVITIRSTGAHERLNSSQHVENWLSQSVILNNDQLEKENEEYAPNVDFMTTIRKSTILSAYRETTSTLNERQILQRKKLLQKCAKAITEESKQKQPMLTDKKITDFFKILDEKDKLKQIPKSTNKVKKVSQPICTARLVDGKPYYSRKLPTYGLRWCQPRFYKFLQDKIKDEYEEETINESENIMKNIIIPHVKTILKSKKYLKEEIDKFKVELAQRKIVSTYYDFYNFCMKYLPREYRDKVVPRTQAFTSEPTVPCPNKHIFESIL